MNKILFLDTLTTGLDPERCAIYKMGGIFCEMTVTGIRELKRMDYYIRPHERARVVDNSLWIGGETRGNLALFPEQEKVFKDFVSLLNTIVNVRDPKDKIYVASFNASSFDVPFLKNWFLLNENQRFRDYFYVQTLDLMSLSAFALINERQSMPDFHLETTAKFLGVAPEHTAKYNCIANAETCLEMFKILRERMKTGENIYYEKTEDIVCNHK